MRPIALLVLLFAPACRREASPSPAPSASASEPAPLASASPSSVEEDAATPPPPPPLRELVGRSLELSLCASQLSGGYSRDGSLFLRMSMSGDTAPFKWEVEDTKTGKVTVHLVDARKYADHDAWQAAGDKSDKELEEFITAQGIAPYDLTRWNGPPWPYEDLRFTSEVTPPDAQPVVSFGARVGEEEPVVVHRFTLPKNTTGMSPDEKRDPKSWGWPENSVAVRWVGLSPDGRELGVIAHGCGSFWVEEVQSWRTPVNAFAARVYNDTGMRHHARADYAGAAKLFDRAASIADEALFAYNRACAHARLVDAEAKPALAHALALSPSAKARAKKDADFEAVRGEAWFKELTR